MTGAPWPADESISASAWRAAVAQIDAADENNRVIVRFVGDPCGYVTERWRVQPPTGWVPATVGRNGGKAVKINLAQAYVIEAYVPDEAVDL